MAENTYTLKLIIEAVNRADAVLKEVGTKIQALDVQARRGGEVVSQAGAAVREKFGQVGQGVEQARNVVQQGAAAMASATQGAGEQMTGPIDRMRTGFKNLQGELATLPFGIGAMASSFIGAYAAMASMDFIIRKVMSTATEALQKFSDLRLVGLQLEAAWEGSGRKMPIDQLRKYTAAIAENSLFGRKSVETAAKQLAIFPAITDEMLPKALNVAAMMSAFKGGSMDIETAAMVLGRASTGMVGALTRMGFPLSAAAKESKDFEVILAELEKKLGGALPAVMSTWSAQLTLLEKSYNKLKVAIGEFLTPALQPAMAAHVKTVEEWGDTIKGTLQDGELNEVQKWIRDTAFIVKALGDSLKDALTAWLQFQSAMRGGGKEGREGEGKQEETWLQWANRISQVVGEKMLPHAMLVKWMREKGKAAQESFEKGMDEGKKGTGISDLFFEGGIPKGPSPITTQLQEAQEQAKRFRKETEGIELLHPEDKKAFKEFFDESDRWLKILAAIQKGLEGAGETAQKAVRIDWDAALERAKAYFTAEGSLQKLRFEEEKTLVLANTQSKEQAERALADLEISHSQRRIEAAQREYEAIRALTAKKFEEEEAQLRKRLGNEENAEEEIRKLREKRAQADATTEQKLTEIITQELNQRLQALQKVNEQLRDHAEKVKDAHASAEKAVRDTIAASMSEWGKYQVKLAEVRDLMARAAENIQTAPAKALELAQNARSVIQSLAVDVDSLLKSYQQFERSAFTEQQEMRKKGKTPAEQARIDAETYGRKMEEAYEGSKTGDFKEAAASAAEARAIAKKQYEAAPRGSRAEKDALDRYTAALDMERRMRQAEVQEAKKRHEEAITLQKENNDLIRQAMNAQKEELQKQRDKIQEAIQSQQALVEALKENTAALGGKTAGEAGTEQSKAGAQSEHSIPAGATSEYQPMKEEVNPPTTGADFFAGLASEFGAAFRSSIERMGRDVMESVRVQNEAIKTGSGTAGYGAETSAMSDLVREFRSVVGEMKEVVGNFGQGVDRFADTDIDVKAVVTGSGGGGTTMDFS